MAPNLLGSSALFLAEATSTQDTSVQHRSKSTVPQSSYVQENEDDKPKYVWHIVWRNVIAFLYLHVAAVYGLYLTFFEARWQTGVWLYMLAVLGGMGITAGAHRLWAHRAYKAKWQMRVVLAILQTMAFQNHIYEWVRDHRVHHKFTDTDADPHNSRRGFFFSHIGWLMVKKHRDVIVKGKTVDMSDLEADPIVRWQRATYVFVMPLLCFAFPAFVPWYFWNENGWTSWYVASICRYTLSLNGTWLVNSAAHMWGTKPYDKNISPTDSLSVGFGAFGEGWHNYHHVFPWDYKAAELGNYRANFTTAFIDFFAKIGWAYDLKTVPEQMIKKRLARTGDGTHIWAPNDSHDVSAPVAAEDHHHNEHSHDGQIWGWGDKDMQQEDINDAQIINKVVKQQ